MSDPLTDEAIRQVAQGQLALGEKAAQLAKEKADKFLALAQDWQAEYDTISLNNNELRELLWLHRPPVKFLEIAEGV